MKAVVKLFKAVPIKTKGQTKVNLNIWQKTIKRGFIFSPDVIYNYPEKELDKLITIVEKEIGLTAHQINSSFHKSWKKVAEADLEQLIVEQIIHYITTYGFERIGIYNQDSVYIPNEELDIPDIDINDLKLVVIKGYTIEEIKTKLFNLLKSGIALEGDTIKDVIDIATFVDINEEDIETIKNKEVKCSLYDYLDVIPKLPVEFLRFLVYKSINKTLLIKTDEILQEIKSKDNLKILSLLQKYDRKHGLKNLAEIFYRFKPIFLAFRTNRRLKTIVNKLRKLAIKYHKPLKEDYLNTITHKIKYNWQFNEARLRTGLEKVNTFRKIRLAYALNFRTQDVNSIVYRIRNGKAYATEFSFDNKEKAKEILAIVIESIIKDVSKKVRNKKIYIPHYIKYALPTTEKQFTGDFPSGTYITVPNDMIVGVHWNNVKNNRIDLDLSMTSLSVGKIGWDSYHRTESRNILFSGDITDAPGKKGASELFYIKKQYNDSFLLNLNYYNYEEDIEVPFKIIIAQEKPKSFGQNYTVNPNNIITIAKSKINKPQKMLGLLVTTALENKFYFVESSIGKNITSSNSELTEKSREYLSKYYMKAIEFNDILKKAGGIIVANAKEADIDLSPEKIEKDTILSLIV